jgi:hypothetical protein
MPPKRKFSRKNALGFINPSAAAQEVEGFPKKIQQVFRAVCEEKNTIILSRVPGKAALQLIEEGYAQKGYHIKAKSCDWGPMAGFVCKQPIFNKKGLANLLSNLKAHVNYHKEMSDVLKLDHEHPKYQIRGKRLFPDGVPEKESLNLFIPLKISEERKSNILKSKSVILINQNKDAILLFGFNKQPDSKDIFPNKTVASIFLLKKEQELWSIHHGPIKVFFEKEWKEYEGTSSSSISSFFPDEDLNPEELSSFGSLANTSHPKDKIDHKVSQLNPDSISTSLFSGFDLNKKPTLSFFKVFGLCNPEDLHEPEESRPVKKAVTGDYDLFSIWPSRITGTNKEVLMYPLLERRAAKFYRDQLRKGTLNISSRSTPVNIHNPFSLALSPMCIPDRIKVVIEFIPHYSEIKPLESVDLGNFTEYGFNLIRVINEKAKELVGENTPQIVKHSDEGGRPGISEIDLPLAVFHPPGFLPPPGLPESKKDTGFIGRINNILEFVNHLERIVQEIQNKSEFNPPFLAFNHGWIAHLLLLSLYEPDPAPNKYQKKDATDQPDPSKFSFAIPKKLVDDLTNKKSLLNTPLENLLHSVNQEFCVAVNQKQKNNNQNWTPKPANDQLYNEERLMLFKKVVFTLFNFIPNTDESDQNFKDRLFPFLHNFTVKLLEYTLDGSMKAVEGLNNVRSTLVSPEYSQTENPYV